MVVGVVEIIVIVGGLDDGVVDVVVVHMDKSNGVAVFGEEFVEIDFIKR